MLPRSVARGDRYGGRDDRFGDLVLPWFRAMSQQGAFGQGCCNACWHAYRKSQVVTDDDGLELIGTLVDVIATDSFPVGEDAPGPLRLVEWSFDPDDPTAADPDPAALARLVRELVPGARCSPNYLLRVASHPVLMPHFLPIAPTNGHRPPPLRSGAGEGVRIGVLDTGSRRQHPWWGVDRVTGDAEDPPTAVAELQRGHGTFIVGLLRRLAEGARVVVRKLPVGCALTEWDAANGLLDLGLDRAVGIVNVSLGICPAEDLPPLALPTAVRRIERERGDDVVIVAAAGNDASTHPRYPAAYKSVIGVGAALGPNKAAPYSNTGWWVDASAKASWRSAYFGDPGNAVEVPGLGRFEGFAFWEGTSFAAPVVAARVAAACAAGGGTPREAADRLLRGGPTLPGLGTYVG